MEEEERMATEYLGHGMTQPQVNEYRAANGQEPKSVPKDAPAEGADSATQECESLLSRLSGGWGRFW